MKQCMNAGGLARELAGLSTFDRGALAERWRELYRTEPPARIGSGFLISAIAYRLQEQALGSLTPATRRYLEKIADNTTRKSTSSYSSDAVQKVAAPTASVKPGTRLLREWHGMTYEVLVLENGVQCNGVQYRSLSQVARAITGSQWSGPLFFGLRRKRASS